MSAPRMGFTGTRKGMTEPQKRIVRVIMQVFFVKHKSLHINGLCYGADRDALLIAHEIGYLIDGHPSTIEMSVQKDLFGLLHNLYAPRDPMLRNCDIVRGSDRMIATPGGMNEEVRSGTWHAIRQTRGAIKPLYIVWPDGKLTVENNR